MLVNIFAVVSKVDVMVILENRSSLEIEQVGACSAIAWKLMNVPTLCFASMVEQLPHIDIHFVFFALNIGSSARSTEIARIY